MIGIGLFLAGIGVVIVMLGRLGWPLGHLPGDIHIEGKNFSFSFPLTTSLLLSLALTVLLNLIDRLGKK